MPFRQTGLKNEGVNFYFLEKKMSRSSNDDRSDSMNPNNDAYDASEDNRSDQLNPNNDEYRGDQDDSDE